MARPFKIETPRLILRDREVSEAPAANEYGSDPIVVRFLTFGPNTLSQSREFIRKIRKQCLVKPRQTFELAVQLKSESKVIGGCRIGIHNSDLREGSIGYGFNRKYWGQGYATETVQALIRFGFAKLKLHRLWATCDVKNKASASVMEKSGLRWEGTLRENLLQKEKWRNTHLYAVLDKDFKRQNSV
jgi:RimJ/RimL family protein N-acetyltransferase